MLSGSFFKDGLGNIGHAFGICLQENRSKRPIISPSIHDNIIKAEVERTFDKDRILIGLYEYFDSTGTIAIKSGTGDSLHPKVAVVVANKLLYVVDNTTKIEKGVMCIMVGQYPEYEIEAMKKAIQEKR